MYGLPTIRSEVGHVGGSGFAANSIAHSISIGSLFRPASNQDFIAHVYGTNE
jgi:hypothetical protein